MASGLPVQHQSEASLCVLLCDTITFPSECTEAEVVCHWYASTPSNHQAHRASEVFIPGAPGKPVKLAWCVFLMVDASADVNVQLTVSTLDGNHLGVFFGNVASLALGEQFDVGEVVLKNVEGTFATAIIHAAKQVRWFHSDERRHSLGTCDFLEAGEDSQCKLIYEYLYPNKPLPPSSRGATRRASSREGVQLNTIHEEPEEENEPSPSPCGSVTRLSPSPRSPVLESDEVSKVLASSSGDELTSPAFQVREAAAAAAEARIRAARQAEEEEARLRLQAEAEQEERRRQLEASAAAAAAEEENRRRAAVEREEMEVQARRRAEEEEARRRALELEAEQEEEAAAAARQWRERQEEEEARRRAADDEMRRLIAEEATRRKKEADEARRKQQQLQQEKLQQQQQQQAAPPPRRTITPARRSLRRQSGLPDGAGSSQSRSPNTRTPPRLQAERSSLAADGSGSIMARGAKRDSSARRTSAARSNSRKSVTGRGAESASPPRRRSSSVRKSIAGGASQTRPVVTQPHATTLQPVQRPPPRSSLSAAASGSAPRAASPQPVVAATGSSAEMSNNPPTPFWEDEGNREPTVLGSEAPRFHLQLPPRKIESPASEKSLPFSARSNPSEASSNVADVSTDRVAALRSFMRASLREQWDSDMPDQQRSGSQGGSARGRGVSPRTDPPPPPDASTYRSQASSSRSRRGRLGNGGVLPKASAPEPPRVCHAAVGSSPRQLLHDVAVGSPLESVVGDTPRQVDFVERGVQRTPSPRPETDMLTAAAPATAWEAAALPQHDGQSVAQSSSSSSTFSRRRLYKVATAAIAVRVGPDVSSARTGAFLRRGDVFEASVVAPGVDGRVYLKLAGSRGWVFDDSEVDPADPSVEPATDEDWFAQQAPRGASPGRQRRVEAFPPVGTTQSTPAAPWATSYVEPVGRETVPLLAPTASTSSIPWPTSYPDHPGHEAIPTLGPSASASTLIWDMPCPDHTAREAGLGRPCQSAYEMSHPQAPPHGRPVVSEAFLAAMCGFTSMRARQPAARA